MDFQLWITEQIRLSGLNQKDFAKLVGLSGSVISRYVGGGLPGFRELTKICAALEVPFLGAADERARGNPDEELRRALLMHPDLSNEEANFFIRLIMLWIKEQSGGTM